MTIIVSLDMYSGRPNPSWEISESDAKKLRKILRKKRYQSSVSSPASSGRLGYRGLIISGSDQQIVSHNMRAFDGILEVASLDTPNYVDHDSEMETFLLSTAGIALHEQERQYIKSEIEKNVIGGIANSMSGLQLLAIPPYNPEKWNDNATVLRNNNCYNYGNDTITNTFAQPGRGTGKEGPFPPECGGTGQAAIRDGLISVPNPNITPADGHISALVVSTTPGFLDYHWYRRDNNGMWSHKPGQTSARNMDNSGKLIEDPQSCDRGPYNNFCNYFNSIPSKISIR